MSIGADPQMTLRDYFARHNGRKHIMITNILNDQIEFYVRPDELTEVDGMHFVLNMEGKISEVGIWEEDEE